MSEIPVLNKRFNATKSLVRQAVTDYLRTANLPHRKPLVLWTKDNEDATLFWAWTSIYSPPDSSIIFVSPHIHQEPHGGEEEYIGDIELTGEIPVEVEIVCVHEPALEFFQLLAHHLKVYLPQATESAEGGEKIELFVEEIDSFSKAENIQSQDVKTLLPLNLSEDRIQTFLEEIIGENFHQQDWGGELNDLVTSHIRVKNERLRAAFLLKGKGTKGKLTISKCGKNGDQIVRLVEAPVDLYVIQHVDEVDERVIYDLRSKVQLKVSQNHKCQFCILDGTETARILKAYGKI